MRCLNKVSLIGAVGNDPDIRTTQGGAKCAQFSLATGRTWKDQSGTEQSKTEWHRCIVWNNRAFTLADVVEKYIRKGAKLYVEGAIEYRQWQDKDGITRYTTEINVRELIMLGAKDDSGQVESRSSAPPKRTNKTPLKPVDDNFDDFPGALDDDDDSLPF